MCKCFCNLDLKVSTSPTSHQRLFAFSRSAITEKCASEMEKKEEPVQVFNLKTFKIVKEIFFYCFIRCSKQTSFHCSLNSSQCELRIKNDMWARGVELPRGVVSKVEL